MPQRDPKINLSMPTILLKLWPMMPVNCSGTKTIKYVSTNQNSPENLNDFFFFFKAVSTDIAKDNSKPPTHNPDTTSSMPMYRHSPRPEAMATVQTGQVALVS